jgi:hypothetical protein
VLNEQQRRGWLIEKVGGESEEQTLWIRIGKMEVMERKKV